jgi:XkdW protein
VAYQAKDIVIAIKSLYPILTVNVDWEVGDTGDGQGPRIIVWHRTDVPQPTQAQIEAVDTATIVAAQATVLPQDLLAQLTADDMTKIQTAISADANFLLLWSAMLAQKDPMSVSSARFKQGWAALVQVLEQPRMTAIAAALGITIS